MAGPAYRIETSRLVIRVWEPRDAPLLKEAVDASLEHLRPWLPWSHRDPQPLEEKISLLRRFRGEFDLDRDFFYGIFDPAETRVVGGTGLHTGPGLQAREIGYWVAAAELGHGYATEAVAALTRVAFEVDGMERVEIRVAPGNERSLRIPRSLGYAEEATLRGRGRDHDDRPVDLVVFSLFRDGYPATPCASAPLTAYDAAGRTLVER